MENDCTDRPRKTERSSNLWLLLLLVISAPLTGWRKLKASAQSGQDFATTVFYPLIAFTSLSEFAVLFFDPKTPLQTILVSAIICFASWFFSYFVIQMFYRILFKGETLDALCNPFGQKFIMTTLSSLCMYMIIYNFVPMLETVLVFFPIYTIYLIFKGIPSLLLPRMRTRRTVAFVVGLNIMVPFILYYLLKWMLESAMI